MRRRAIERARTEQAQPMAKPAYAYGRTTSAKHFDASDTARSCLRCQITIWCVYDSQAYGIHNLTLAVVIRWGNHVGNHSLWNGRYISTAANRL
jgi:hypothetical protein